MRRGRAPVITVIPVLLLSFVGAGLVLPEGQQRFLQWATYLAGPLELFLIAFVLTKVYQARRRFKEKPSLDIYEQLRQTLRELIPARGVAHAAAFEVALLYYAFLSWRSTPSPLDQDTAFSYHRKSGYGALLCGAMIAGFVEMVGVHLLLRMWSETAAWILTGLSLYSLVWLLGAYRAAVLRPVLLTEEGLFLREGLTKEITVPFEKIAWVSPVGRRLPDRKTEGYLQVSALARPRFLLKLKEPVAASGVYGWEKKVDLIGIGIDEPDRFEKVLVRYFEAWQTRRAL